MSRVTLLCIIVLMVGCGAFGRLKQELDDTSALLVSAQGQLEADSCVSGPIVLALLADLQGEEVLGVYALDSAGLFEVHAPTLPFYVFAFCDANNDLSYQDGENYGWYQTSIEKISAAYPGAYLHVRVTAARRNSQLVPVKLDIASLTAFPVALGIAFSAGAITALDSPLFSRLQAQKGLWQPLSFMRDGGAGIHFLTRYDTAKTPVLFVHGISGSPRDFTYLIEHLDRSRFQVWVASYPSGYRLESNALRLYALLSFLQRRHGFSRLHIVAHSMGGLVARGLLNQCATNGCRYISSFTSIATPWGGHDRARAGVDYAPVAVPAWQDIVPGSEYIEELFETPLPDGLNHYLVFGYKGMAYHALDNSDGVVSIASALDRRAQAYASQVRGFNEDHIGILSSPEVQTWLGGVLSRHKVDRLLDRSP